MISYRLNENNQKVKMTRRIRYTTHTEKVSPRVAERKTWSKFGLSQRDPAGPAPDTTSVGENIIFRPSATWRRDQKEEGADVNAQAMKDKLKDKKLKCRICNGEHFTARCPYKDTMAPVGQDAADVAAGMGDDGTAGGAPAAGGAGGAGGAGLKKGSYVPPALRGVGGPAGEKLGGKYPERDDLATLRVTNVSSIPRSSPRQCSSNTSFPSHRSPSSPRNRSCATCSSASAASRASSSPRTARRAWPRASPSSASPTAATPSRPPTRWTVSVSSISSSGSSLPRRRRKRRRETWGRKKGERKRRRKMYKQPFPEDAKPSPLFVRPGPSLDGGGRDAGSNRNSHDDA
jgi:translation initiation factor 3 subunit